VQCGRHKSQYCGRRFAFVRRFSDGNLQTASVHPAELISAGFRLNMHQQQASVCSILYSSRDLLTLHHETGSHL
jgi:hypothetical protein